MSGEIKGIITALVTPFRPDDSIDEEGLRVLLRRQVKQGIHGVAVVAGRGEEVADMAEVGTLSRAQATKERLTITSAANRLNAPPGDG